MVQTIHAHETPDGTCRAPECGAGARTVGYCPKHYQQIRRHGRLTPERERAYGRTGCRVPGCQEAHSSRGFCKRHYMSEYYLPLKQDESAVATKRAAA